MFIQSFEHVKWWEFTSISWMSLSLAHKNQECTELLLIPPNYRRLCELKRISHDKLTDSLSSSWAVLLSPENGIKCNFFYPSCLFKHICQSLPQNGHSSLKKSFRVRKSFGCLTSNCSPFPFLSFESLKVCQSLGWIPGTSWSVALLLFPTANCRNLRSLGFVVTSFKTPKSHCFLWMARCKARL